VPYAGNNYGQQAYNNNDGNGYDDTLNGNTLGGNFYPYNDIELPPPPPPTELPKAYAVNESATFWGDPHIVDADRADKTNDRATSFDVTDEGLYNILEDKV
jgi:hypothetical protein